MIVTILANNNVCVSSDGAKIHIEGFEITRPNHNAKTYYDNNTPFFKAVVFEGVKKHARLLDNRNCVLIN